MSASMQKALKDTQNTIGRPDTPLSFRTASDCGAESLCSNVAMAEPAKPVITEKQAALLRQVPSVDELLLRPRIAALVKAHRPQFPGRDRS